MNIIDGFELLAYCAVIQCIVLGIFRAAPHVDRWMVNHPRQAIAAIYIMVAVFVFIVGAET